MRFFADDIFLFQEYVTIDQGTVYVWHFYTENGHKLNILFAVIARPFLPKQSLRYLTSRDCFTPLCSACNDINVNLCLCKVHIGEQGNYLLTEYDDLDGILKLNKVDFQISLRYNYHQIEFKMDE